DSRMQEATARMAESRDVFKLGELYTRAAMGEAAWQALPAAQRSGYRAKDGYDDVARELASFLSAELFEVAGAPHLVHVAQPHTFAHLVRRTVSLGSHSLNTDRSP